MEYKVSYQYHLGRLLYSIATIYMGIQIYTSGHEFYSPYWHALRKTIDPKSTNRIDGYSFTFDDVNKYTTLAMGVLLILGGILTLANQRTRGPVFCIAAVILMIITQDNPWIRDQIKPKPKTTHIRYNDFFRHLSLIGASLFLMVTPPEEEEVKKVKAE
jgi:uncharacterized membrane protein YphA (DoxX/SURF4 family)